MAERISDVEFAQHQLQSRLGLRRENLEIIGLGLIVDIATVLSWRYGMGPEYIKYVGALCGVAWTGVPAMNELYDTFVNQDVKKLRRDLNFAKIKEAVMKLSSSDPE